MSLRNFAWFVLLICISQISSASIKKVLLKNHQFQMPWGQSKTITDYLYTDSAGNTYIELKQTNYSYYPKPKRDNYPYGNDSNLKTTFTKVKLDVSTMTIDTSDFTYSTSSGRIKIFPSPYNKKLAFGTAYGCEESWSVVSTAIIDLRGTAFQIDDTFTVGGYNADGSATFSNNNQMVTLKAGGYCGYIGPATAVTAGEEAVYTGGAYIKVKYTPALYTS